MQNIAEKLSPTKLLCAYDHIEGLHGKTPLIPFGVVHKDGFEVVVYAKMDTLNPGGSFKDRGAEYFIKVAVDDGILQPGDKVVTASAGNHAKGVAKAARQHGLNAIIYMSSQTPKMKIKGTIDLGAQVELVGGDYHAAAVEAQEFSQKNKVLYVPAYQHEDVIMGQSTVATEAMMQLFSRKIRPDFVVSPFGGGGLSNGIGYALRYFDGEGMFPVNGQQNKIWNYAVQAENFDAMARSFREGKVADHIQRGETIADGIRVAKASEEMLRLSERNIDDIFTVSEEEIREAIRRVYSSDLISALQKLHPKTLQRNYGFSREHINNTPRMNIVEGAAAAAFACVFSSNKIDYNKIARQAHPRKIINGVVIASGNNIDQGLLEQIVANK